MSQFPQENNFANLTVNQTLVYGDVSLPHHVATKWYVDQEISNLISGAPGTLDTLREIVDFIGDESTVFTIVSRLSAAESSREDISRELHSEISNVIGRIDIVSGDLVTEISGVESRLDVLSAELSNTTHVLRMYIDEVSSALSTGVGVLEGKISELSSNVTVQIEGEVEKLETAISSGLAGKLDDGRVRIISGTNVYEITCEDLLFFKNNPDYLSISTAVTIFGNNLRDNGITLVEDPLLHFTYNFGTIDSNGSSTDYSIHENTVFVEPDDIINWQPTTITVTLDDTVPQNVQYITDTTGFGKWILDETPHAPESDGFTPNVLSAVMNDETSVSTTYFERYRKMSPSKGGHFQIAEPSNNLEAYLYIGNHWRITTANIPGKKQLNFEYNSFKPNEPGYVSGWTLGIPFFMCRDTDGDGVPDVEDPDIDGDGFSNEIEIMASTDIMLSSDVPRDTDGDGLVDVIDHDIDGDGFSNEVELMASTDIMLSSDVPRDTDGDGKADVVDSDIDGDGFSNEVELMASTDIMLSSEVPLDTDGDGLVDVVDPDIDGDGFSNEVEIMASTDIYNESSFPTFNPRPLDIEFHVNSNGFQFTIPGTNTAIDYAKILTTSLFGGVVYEIKKTFIFYKTDTSPTIQTRIKDSNDNILLDFDSTTPTFTTPSESTTLTFTFKFGTQETPETMNQITTITPLDENSNGIDDIVDLDGDPDYDGFTNQEEIEASTDILDSNSKPSS